MKTRYLACAMIMSVSMGGCSESGGRSENSAVSTTLAAASVTEEAQTTFRSSTPSPIPPWVPETVGTIDGGLGNIDAIAFAPDGTAVAFSLIDTSCCSNRVVGWAKNAGGTWKKIDAETAGFVVGADGLGAYGGPTEVIWFDGRFVAVGTRGGQSEPERASTSVTWVSGDGLSWRAYDDTTGSRMSGLAVSPDGTSLLGVRTTEEGAAEIRSTTDGASWTTVARVTSGKAGTVLSSLSLARVSRGAEATRYVLFGSWFETTADGASRTGPFAAISEDGRSWNPVDLTVPPTATPQSVTMTNAVMLDASLILYGFGYGGAGDDDVTQFAWRSIDMSTFEQLSVSEPCGGTITSVVADQRAPEPTMFAVCSVVVGPVEGDSVDIRTTLVISRNGAQFEVAPVRPPDLGEPSVEVNLGPLITRPNGAVTIAVAKPGAPDVRTVTVWTS